MSRVSSGGDGLSYSGGKVDQGDDLRVRSSVLGQSRPQLLLRGAQAAAGGVDIRYLFHEGAPEQVLLALVVRGKPLHVAMVPLSNAVASSCTIQYTAARRRERRAERAKVTDPRERVLPHITRGPTPPGDEDSEGRR